MKRRSFLAMLISLPFMSWAKPEPDANCITLADGSCASVKPCMHWVGFFDKKVWLPEYPILYQYSQYKGPDPHMGILDADKSLGIEELLQRVTIGERNCGCPVSHYEVWCYEPLWQDDVCGDANGWQWTHLISINKPYTFFRETHNPRHVYQFVAVYKDGQREQVPYLVSPPTKKA